MSWYYEDNNGVIPEVGDYIAYNWSGQIAAGYITHYKGKNKPITIERVIPDPEPGESNKSTVRGGCKCVLVLQKRDGSVSYSGKSPDMMTRQSTPGGS